jgi:hypothetical protein
LSPAGGECSRGWRVQAHAISARLLGGDVEPCAVARGSRRRRERLYRDDRRGRLGGHRRGPRPCSSSERRPSSPTQSRWACATASAHGRIWPPGDPATRVPARPSPTRRTASRHIARRRSPCSRWWSPLWPHVFGLEPVFPLSIVVTGSPASPSALAGAWWPGGERGRAVRRWHGRGRRRLQGKTQLRWVA